MSSDTKNNTFYLNTFSKHNNPIMSDKKRLTKLKLRKSFLSG
jgi:hypothetical protein